METAPNVEALIPEVEELKDWIKLAKYHKKLWVECTERGDLTPTVFAERNGEIVCAVVAPQVDKELGYKAAAMLRRGMNADVITMIFDAHMSHGKAGESEEEFTKKWKPGEMQRMCDEEGACETGLIADTLICHRIGEDKKIKMANIPYSYHGKGSKFRWLNDPQGYHEYCLDENVEGVSISGNVPRVLRQIMDLSSLLDDPLVSEAATRMGVSKERKRQLYHTTRALYTVLSTEGYAVFDYMGHSAPYEEFVKNLEN